MSKRTKKVADGCPACGRDIDKLGGNPDCSTCAAEPRAPDKEQVVAIMFKHEDQIRRQPVGPVWKKLKNGTVTNYQDHESMVSVVSKKPTPKWFTLAQARAFATSLGVPLEER